MEFKDYYQHMGLARDATADDIKKAYRRLARKYHPDVSKEADAETRFKEIGEANEVLKDPEKRAAYDRLRANWKAGQAFQPPPDWDTGVEGRGRGFDDQAEGDYSDFFEALFRGAKVPGGTRRHRASSPVAAGEDRHARIQIDLEEAYQGARRTLALQVPEVDAQGRVSMRAHEIAFEVPRGVRAGQHIRLAGQGGPGIGGAAPGDLYLEITFRPHPHYRVDQRDVYLDLPVAPWEAVLGAQVRAPTPGGSLELTVPPGSVSGRKLRVRGRGIPGTPPGDFYFVLQIALPVAEQPQAQEAYRAFATQFAGFDPRARLGAMP